MTARAARGAAPAKALTGQTGEFRLDIVTSPDEDGPAAVVRFCAASAAEAVEQGRRLLATHDGPDDRYGELYQRNGDRGDHLTTIHLGV